MLLCYLYCTVLFDNAPISIVCPYKEHLEIEKKKKKKSPNKTRLYLLKRTTCELYYTKHLSVLSKTNVISIGPNQFLSLQVNATRLAGNATQAQDTSAERVLGKVQNN